MKKLTSVLIFLFFINASVQETLSAQDTDTIGLSPMQVAKLKQVNEIDISGDGNQIAYTLQVQSDPTEENKAATNELYLVNRAQDDLVPFVTTMDVSNIAFRPGQNSITFLGRRDGEQPISLFEVSLSGGEPREIYSFETSISNYTWAPDGNHLAFMAGEPQPDKKAKLPYQPEIYEENLVNRRGYVTNVTMDGHKPHQMQVEGSVYQMKWSPDGDKLAIAVAPTPLVDDYYMSQQIFIVDHHGEEVIGKVDHEGKLGQFEWSPDGNRIAMIAAADVHDPIAGRLFTVSAKGGKPTQLYPDYNGMFEDFMWSTNNTIHYISSESLWSDYGTVNVDGSSLKPIIETKNRNLSDFDRASDGTVIFNSDSPFHPSELYISQQNADSLERITFSNPWLKDVELGRQEAISWNAEDGLELHGLLIYPLDYTEGKRYPLITVVHGGPESHYNYGWLTDYSDPGQVGAADGYFVFYPNYRGSTGRGEEFAKSSQGDLAGKEFEDIVDGVDHLISEGLVDKDRVGVTGGSYGGYATGWMATRYTDRFAAGVMFVGISNNISKWGTSDIPEELYLVHARQRIWEGYQEFLERSPIYYAGQAKTPLLIMHGKEDTRVFPSQSYELYRHIKTRTDTPVRLVLYPEEGHGNRKSTARYDYNLRMMRWFNEYLKGEKNQHPASELELESTTIQN